MTHLYRDAANILRANGYAPAAISPGHNVPLGAWAVGQVNYAECERPESEADAAVFTSCRPARSSFAGVIANPPATWLGTIKVGDMGNLAPKVEAVIAKHVGKSPVRVDVDGATVRPFRVVGAFSRTSHDASVRIECGLASFVALTGEWRDGDLLTVPRSELPELDEARVEALIDDLDALLDQRAPMPSFTPTPTPPPAPLPRADALRWSDTAAVEKLRENGYRPAQMPWGAHDGWKGVIAGWLKATDQGVGIATAPPLASWEGRHSDVWLVTMTVQSSVRELHDLIARHVGGAPARVSSDGERIYVLRQGDGYTWATAEFIGDVQKNGMPVRDTFSTVRVESHNRTVVIAGRDSAGKPYTWPKGDLLSVPRAALPSMTDNRAHNLVREVRQLFERLSLARAS